MQTDQIRKENHTRAKDDIKECLLEDTEACLSYNKYSYQQCKRKRTTNVLERSFKELKRRTKGIRFNDGQSALAMALLAAKGTKLKWSKYGISGKSDLCRHQGIKDRWDYSLKRY